MPVSSHPHFLYIASDRLTMSPKLIEKRVNHQRCQHLRISHVVRPLHLVFIAAPVSDVADVRNWSMAVRAHQHALQCSFLAQTASHAVHSEPIMSALLPG